MRLSLISPGKFKERWQREAAAEYSKRLSRYCETEILEVPDAPDSLPLEKALEREGEAIARRIPARSFLIALEIEGKMMSSEELAATLEGAFREGDGQVSFVIGGSRGLSPEIAKRARVHLSLSRLTFTHLMARILLLEQLYRSFKILAGEPYHK